MPNPSLTASSTASDAGCCARLPAWVTRRTGTKISRRSSGASSWNGTLSVFATAGRLPGPEALRLRHHPAAPQAPRVRGMVAATRNRTGVERRASLALVAHEDLPFRPRSGRDFTERDRLVLDRLKPHLARLWRAARTRRVLGSATSALGQADEHDARGVILLGVAGEIEFASPPSLRLLREYFPPAPRITHRCSSSTGWPPVPAPLVRRLEGRRLTIEHRTAPFCSRSVARKCN